MTRGQFAARVMKERGIPETLHNRRAFAAWLQSEGGSALNNPLNTTLHTRRSTRYNFADVQNYPDLLEGIGATVKTFDTPQQGYGKFESAMMRNAPARTTCRLIGESSWGTGKKLILEVWEWIARNESVLRMLERKEIAS